MAAPLSKYPKPLRLSIVEGMFASVMIGGGLVFIIPFAVFLGANSIQIGLLSAVPALFAAWFQLFALKLLQIYKSRKNIIVACVGIQAISWLIIAAIPFLFPSEPITWLVTIATVGTIIGSIANPLWHSWMRSLTPQQILGNYFGMRNALTNTIVFAATLLCGFALELAMPEQLTLIFGAIFFASFVGRVISSILLTKIDEPEFIYKPKEKIGLNNYINQLGKNNFGHFVLFGTLMTFTIGMIGPFISLYFLESLGLQSNYFLFTILIASAALTTIVSMPYWGKIIDKYGTVRVLQATGFLVCFYPLLLILIKDPYFLIIVQLFDGIVFSGFTLSIANFIYESFKPEKIIKYATFQTVFFGTATFAGAMISGYLLTLDLSFGMLSGAFMIVCLITFVLRTVIYALLIPKIKDIGEITFIKKEKIVLKAITFEPVRESLIYGYPFMLSAVSGAMHKVGAFTVKEIKGVESITLKEIEGVEKTAFDEIKKLKNLTKRIASIKKEEIKEEKERKNIETKLRRENKLRKKRKLI